MTRTTIRGVVLVLAVMLPLAAVPGAQSSLEVAFRAAVETETVKGDLRAAIEQYRRIAEAPDRALAARALVRMAECYEKLGAAEARAIYERVVREFADQTGAVAEARARLAALPSPTSAQTGQVARLVWTGPDAFRCSYGAVSLDGRYLNCSGIIRDVREGTSRRLTSSSDGGVFNSVFSPDGRQVAYEWGSDKDFTYDLRVLPFVGSEAAQPRILYRNDETRRIRPFAWTADGHHLLVLRGLKDGTNQIAMISVQDGSIRVLKSLAWQYATLSLSPDGRYIAYDAPTARDNPQREILVLSADGTRETALIRHPADDASPLWAPDGSEVLFLSDRTGSTSLWRVPIDGARARGPAELVNANLGRIRLEGVTRTGTLFYLVSGALRRNVYTAELDGALKATRAPEVATDRFVNSSLQPSWSPDGQHLAYYSARGPSTTVLVIRTLKTGEERDLPLPPGVVTGNLLPSPSWFPDGRSVLVLVGTPGKGGAYYRVELANGRAEMLYAPKGIFGQGGLGANAISPDGKTIFYIANLEDPPGGARKLVRLDIASRTETVLTSGQVFVALALSPDGTRLASKRNTHEGCHLEVMRTDGGDVREVFQGTRCGNPNQLAWSPDQRHLVFVRGQNPPNVLWRVPVAGGEPEQLGISMAGQLMYPQVHPDGSRMTFAVLETGASEVWALENFLPKPAKR